MAVLSVQLRLAQPSFPHLQIMRYMGNKRSILDFIIPRLRDQVSTGEVILDLFSGTCAIGYALKRSHTIYANDVQEYSYVISRALLSNNLGIRSTAQARRELQSHYYSNLEALRSAFAGPLETEQQFLGKRVDRLLFTSYRAFCEGYPYYGRPSGSTGYKSDFIRLFSTENIAKYRANPCEFPYMLFSTYFANSYFGVMQCTQIDSLRYAIDQVQDQTKRMVYLTCLISALSNTVSSTGHFAQYRRVNSLESCEAILQEREKPVLPMFYDKLESFMNNFVENGHLERRNRCFNEDYRYLLEDHAEELRDVSLIYADPPYSTAHYSRFYHVPETLVKYDYPENDFVGRYRHDRPMSGFCRYSTVADEFETLFSLSRNLGATLALSYSSKGMITMDRIKRIAGRFYGRLASESWRYTHSRQGRSSKIPLREYLLICTSPKNALEV